MLKLNSLIILLSLVPIQACYSIDEDLFRAALVSEATDHLKNYQASTNWNPSGIYKPGKFSSSSEKNDYYQDQFPESWGEEFYFTCLEPFHDLNTPPRNTKEVLDWFADAIIQDCSDLRPGDLYLFRTEIRPDVFTKPAIGLVIQNDVKDKQIYAVFGSMITYKSNDKFDGITVGKDPHTNCWTGGNIYQAIQ